MTEKAENLAAKHTRAEIEEMAVKLGIATAGISKLKISEALIEARKKAAVVEKPRAKETKAASKPIPTIGKKGVFALQANIANKAADMDSFASDLCTSAMEMQKKGIMEMQQGINAQIKENEKGAAKMESGVRELHNAIAQMKSDIDKKAMGLQKGVNEMHKGVEEIQEGIREMENSYKNFQNDTMEYIRDFYYG